MILGNAAAGQNAHWHLHQDPGLLPASNTWSEQGGYGGQMVPPWATTPSPPWASHSWGPAGWYGGQYQAVFPSFPAYEGEAGFGDTTQQAAVGSAASSSTLEARTTAPQTSSPGRPGALQHDQPAEAGDLDPWQDAARRLVSAATAARNTFATTAGPPTEASLAPSPPDLPRPAMQQALQRDELRESWTAVRNREPGRPRRTTSTSRFDDSMEPGTGGAVERRMSSVEPHGCMESRDGTVGIRSTWPSRHWISGCLERRVFGSASVARLAVQTPVGRGCATLEQGF